MTSSIDNIASMINTPLQQSVNGKNELGQDEFLKLMVTQLQNQDPFKPMEDGQFIAEMAQFGTVSGIDELQKSVDNLASAMVGNQLLDVAPLLGTDVVVQSDIGYFDGESMDGGITVDKYSSSVSMKIYSEGGALIDDINLGPQRPGEVKYSWDGKDSEGNLLAAGRYRITASAVADGKVSALSTTVAAHVDSVALGQGGRSPVLQLQGIGEVSLDNVRQIE